MMKLESYHVQSVLSDRILHNYNYILIIKNELRTLAGLANKCDKSNSRMLISKLVN